MAWNKLSAELRMCCFAGQGMPSLIALFIYFCYIFLIFYLLTVLFVMHNVHVIKDLYEIDIGRFL